MARRKEKKKQKPQKSSFSATLEAAAGFAGSKMVLWLSLVLLVAIVIVYYPNHGGDYDIWWHLKYGEHYVTNHTWNVDHTVYSWTPSNGDWKYVTWIGSSVMYLIYRVAGFAGLHAFQFLVLFFLGILFTVFLRFAKETFGVFHAAALLLVAVAINPTAIFLKPELFTIVLFGITALIYFMAKSLGKSLFWLYPAIFLVWVNTHGAFIIGLFFISMVLAFETADYLFLGENPLEKRLLVQFAVCTALSYAALLINPHGLAYPLETVVRLLIGEKGQYEILTAYINRWDYLFPEVYVFRRTNTAWVLVFMEATVLWGLLAEYLRRRFLDLTLIAVNIVFFLFAMNMARATLYFPVIWIFTVPFVLSKAGASDFARRAAPAALFVLVFVSMVCVHNTVTKNTYSSWFGSRLDEEIPVEEMKYVKDNKLPTPIFNDYLIGGYIIWSLYPDYMVFIDPRHRPFEATGVWEDYVRFRQQPDQDALRRITEKYPFKTAIIHHIKYGDLAAAFMRSPEWTLLYFEKLATVFVRTSELSSLDLASNQPDLGPERFRELGNPTLLYSLFKVYYMINLDAAREIVHIYRNNVGGFYGNKGSHLAIMNQLLAR